MILKDFIEQIRHTKISGTANGLAIRTIELDFEQKSTTSPGIYSVVIEFFDGDKIEKYKFKKLTDITNNLLQARLVRWNIILDIQSNGYDTTTIEFIVSN